MFQKIRLRLTFLCGGITTLITLAMTLGYLYIAEKNLVANRLLSCQNDIFTIAANLEQQSAISFTWLSKLEAGSGYDISILDNGIPFWFNERIPDDNRLAIIENAWNYYRQSKDALAVHKISYRSSYRSFTYDGESMGNSPNYCFVISLDTNGSLLEMLLLLPFSAFSGQIAGQRLSFLAMVFIALLAIWLFAWFFTGRLLAPIAESRRRQNQFIAAASHELRTPLAVILSCAESCTNHHAELPTATQPADCDTSIQRTPAHQKSTHTPRECDSSNRTMDTIKSEALRMKRLLDDLLTLSSRDLGQLNISKSPVYLDTLLLNACESFEAMARDRRVRLSVCLPDDAVPPCDCDRERIYQTLAILLHNALSYTPDGGWISLSLSLSPQYFILSCADSGTGIPDDEKEKIFERFYRMETSRSSKEHFGLGLSIAREIISAHGGRIAVRDTAGGGSTFVVELPH